MKKLTVGQRHLILTLILIVSGILILIVSTTMIVFMVIGLLAVSVGLKNLVYG